jgi:hypothetical protein
MMSDVTTEKIFTPVPKDILASQAIERPNITYWQDAWRRLKMNRVAMISMVVLILIALIAIIGPMIFPHYRENNLSETFQSPNAKYWFGTDDLGRDQFARVLRGSRISLFIGVFVALLTLAIGVIYGGLSGYIGGWLDDLMMRIIDILITIPDMIIMILLLVILKPGVGTLILAGPGTDAPAERAGIHPGGQGAWCRDMADYPEAPDTQYAECDYYPVYHEYSRYYFYRSILKLYRTGDPDPGSQLGEPCQPGGAAVSFPVVAVLHPGGFHQYHHAGFQPLRRRAAGCTGSQTEKVRPKLCCWKSKTFLFHFIPMPVKSRR